MFATVLLSIALVPGLAQAHAAFQDVTAPGSPTQSQGTPTRAQGAATLPHDPNYRLGPADSLSITVLGLPDSAFDTEVSNSGKVHVPYVGVLTVAGMTSGELESEIARSLREQDLVKDPQVSVRVTSYQGNTVYLLGEVAQPGQYYMREEMRVMDLIGLSLGFPTEGLMYLYRRAPVTASAGGDPVVDATSVEEAIPIDIEALSKGLRPDLNYRLRSGDMLYVPYNRPKYFFVTGEVGNAGMFEIPPRRELLVSEAMAFAGGPTRTAKVSDGLLVRYDEQGERQEIALDFNAILKGEQPDFPIAANDIIFIPGSNAKTFAQGFLSFIPSMLTLGF